MTGEETYLEDNSAVVILDSWKELRHLTNNPCCVIGGLKDYWCVQVDSEQMHSTG